MFAEWNHLCELSLTETGAAGLVRLVSCRLDTVLTLLASPSRFMTFSNQARSDRIALTETATACRNGSTKLTNPRLNRSNLARWAKTPGCDCFLNVATWQVLENYRKVTPGLAHTHTSCCLAVSCGRLLT
ncbi:hypothetical protein ElyMa_006042100 [Elysia marginata]|uniref:Uncharacterized protein n=1 Tax=Elysia marginata TaxID=1093978 RepID=A0AAV4GKZ4_9GAST|nr:hypothetical protein ElyMa_006042100 [Elysia marginata]